MSSNDELRILSRLSRLHEDEVWEDFLATYSRLIYQVARRFAWDEDRVSDLYVYVCTELHRSKCRRLRRFEPEGAARFSTWLQLVVRNLCLDRLRQDLGSRPFRGVAKRSALEQEIFRCVYHQGMTLDEALGVLHGVYPGLDRLRLNELLSAMHSEMTSRQFWLLSTRTTREISLSRQQTPEGPELEEHIAAREPNPEAVVRRKEHQAILWQAIEQLTPAQRLLLRLRYELDLPLREVARLAGLKNPQAAHRDIERALKRLEALVPDQEA
jgi:RNA polymerase sigma factor (sigma-70 family)